MNNAKRKEIADWVADQAKERMFWEDEFIGFDLMSSLQFDPAPLIDEMWQVYLTNDQSSRVWPAVKEVLNKEYQVAVKEQQYQERYEKLCARREVVRKANIAEAERLK